jgi:hypothetical protein
VEERAARAEPTPQAAALGVGPAVERVADERVAGVGEVDADLVGAAGLGHGLDERDAGGEPLADDEARARGPPVVADPLRLAPGAAAAERRVDGEAVGGRVAVDQRQVAARGGPC